ncbi:MAG: oxygen-independent coproporphyrinogen III oxidase, partial [Deltaproteobacteria bacterium]|nr:oxygen-independent coproporphyrinogen III oxidase [Deltaproteobacteria bacterium]
MMGSLPGRGWPGAGAGGGREPLAMIDPLLEELEPELLERYQQAGPRYTSYPTIPVWSAGFGEEQLRPHLEAADRQRAGEPLSLYVHLPFCSRRCLYCGCAAWESGDPQRIDRYLDALSREVARWAELLPRRRTLAQLHLGGGTPNTLSVAQLQRLHDLLFAWLERLPGAELALEANPATIAEEQIALLGSLGFNRISFGVQDLTPAVQQAVNRPGSVERTAQLISLARRVGFAGVNLDIVYGLPRQTTASFRSTVEAVVRLGPDRVAVFGYAHVPWIAPHQRALEVYGLPGVHERVALFREAYGVLTAAGYRPIGLDHFARPADELSRALDEGRLDRSFQGYTVNPAPDLIGLGVTAISDVGGAYAQ